jgi:hypothetical protein
MCKGEGAVFPRGMSVNEDINHITSLSGSQASVRELEAESSPRDSRNVVGFGVNNPMMVLTKAQLCLCRGMGRRRGVSLKPYCSV